MWMVLLEQLCNTDALLLNIHWLIQLHLQGLSTFIRRALDSCRVVGKMTVRFPPLPSCNSTSYKSRNNIITSYYKPLRQPAVDRVQKRCMGEVVLKLLFHSLTRKSRHQTEQTRLPGMIQINQVNQSNQSFLSHRSNNKSVMQFGNVLSYQVGHISSHLPSFPQLSAESLARRTACPSTHCARRLAEAHHTTRATYIHSRHLLIHL